MVIGQGSIWCMLKLCSLSTAVTHDDNIIVISIAGDFQLTSTCLSVHSSWKMLGECTHANIP